MASSWPVPYRAATKRGNNVTINNGGAVTANNLSDADYRNAATPIALDEMATRLTKYDAKKNKSITIDRVYNLKTESAAAKTAYITAHKKDYASASAAGIVMVGADVGGQLSVTNSAGVSNGSTPSTPSTPSTAGNAGFVVSATGIKLSGAYASGGALTLTQNQAISGNNKAVGIVLPASLSAKTGDVLVGSTGTTNATGTGTGIVNSAITADGLRVTASAGRVRVTGNLDAGASTLSFTASGDIDASASAITAGSVTASSTGTGTGTSPTGFGRVLLNNSGNKILSFGEISGNEFDIGSSVEFTLTGPLTKKSTADNSVMKVSNYGTDKHINIRYAGNQPTSSVKANKEAGSITATGTGLKFEVKGAGKVMSPTYSYYYPVGSGKKIVNKTSNDGVAYILYNSVKYSAPNGIGATVGTQGKLVKSSGTVDISVSLPATTPPATPPATPTPPSNP